MDITKVACCVYCGNEQDLTDDHVFPEGLFPKPRPQLIKVPACHSCNNGFSLDDEYFRMAMGAAAFRTPAGRQIWSEKIVGSTFKRSPALKAKVADTIRMLDVTTPSGIHLGKAPAALIQMKRVNRIVKRMVIGLYWHHVGMRVPTGTKVTAIMTTPDRLGLLTELNDVPITRIGDGSVVMYKRGWCPERLDLTVWAFCFYGSTTFVGFTGAGSGS